MINTDTRLKELPDSPGVYLMRGRAGKIIYIGKAGSLKKRVASYFRENGIGLKTSTLVNEIKNIDYILTGNAKEALVMEESIIKRFLPKYNVMWKDDKKYPFLKFTREKYPRIAVERKIGPGGKYFGPYPDVTDMKRTLGFLYKTFNIRPCRYDLEKRKEACLYYSIHKCPAPCIGKISEREYGANIRNAAMFLSGRSRELLKSIENEMLDAKNKLDFEKAARMRDKLAAIKNTLQKINFRQVTSDELLLNVDPASYTTDLSKLFKRKINRVEGFDISNISGTGAVGSMVVFENGAPLKNEYRKFKIRTVSGQDDFEMMKEVVGRRYAGSLSKKMKEPDLIVIDGGKGQLSSAMEALNNAFGANPAPAVIGIAKKKEELFFPDVSNPLILSKNSLALNMIRYVRDEAHRFAVSYHKLLRKKLAVVLIIAFVPAFLFCRNGTIYLKNGRSISGNIEMSYDKYIVENRTYSISFDENEIKSIKYSKGTGYTAPKNNETFVRMMKNTKKLKSPAMLKTNNYEYDHLIYFYAKKYNIDPSFVKAVMEAESNFDPCDISCKGAIGLMQIMPETARTMNINPMIIEENIEGGVKYLNEMIYRFGNMKLAVAAYNAGPGAVEKYGKTIPPYKETTEYVERVFKNYRKHKSDNQMWYYIDATGCVHISDYPKDMRYRRLRR